MQMRTNEMFYTESEYPKRKETDNSLKQLKMHITLDCSLKDNKQLQRIKNCDA